MLILTRKPGESVYIGEDVKITVLEAKGNQIRLGIDAPKELRIYREEIYLQIIEENKQAALASKGEAKLEDLADALKSSLGSVRDHEKAKKSSLSSLMKDKKNDKGKK